MSGDENGADPSYVWNDDVNTFYGDVIVAYPVPVVGNGITQSLYCYTPDCTPYLAELFINGLSQQLNGIGSLYF